MYVTEDETFNAFIQCIQTIYVKDIPYAEAFDSPMRKTTV